MKRKLGASLDIHVVTSRKDDSRIFSLFKQRGIRAALFMNNFLALRGAGVPHFAHAHSSAPCGRSRTPTAVLHTLALLLLLAFTACNEKSAVSANLSAIEEAAIATNNAASGKNSAVIDYDLSSMNANMVFSQVFNMMAEPEIYDDKVIKMRGNFAVYDNELTGGKSYAVVIADALACCQQGIEFQYDFAENLPKEGAEITVTGVYTTAMLEGDIAYNFVRASSVEM